MYFSKLTLMAVSIVILILGIIPLYKKRFYKKVMVLQILIYTLFYGLRDKRIGVDTGNYIREYNLGTGGYFELGFQKLGYFLYKFNFSPTQYLSTIILIQLIFIYMGIINFRIRNSYKGIILWGMLTNTIVVFNSINALRQGIAASVLFYVVSLSQNDIVKNEIIKIFAYLNHKSSIIFIFLKIWNKFRLRKLRKLKDYIFIFIFFLVLGMIFKNIFIRLGLFSNSYVDSGSKILLIKLAQVLIIFMILLFTFKKEKRVYKKNISKILMIYSLCIIIIINFYFINEVANRYLYYLGYYTFVILAYFINLYKNRLFLIKILVLLNLSFYYFLINTSSYIRMFKL